MPYIKEELRDDLYYHSISPKHPGELNFLLTNECRNYFEANGQDYRAINDVIGALEGAKLEFYRRVAVPYEDKKIVENGDVY